MKIKRKQGELFTHSEVSKTYPHLVEILTKDKRYPLLNEKQYDKLCNDDKTFLNDNFERIFHIATSEWGIGASTTFADGEINNCQLCGKKHLVDRFTIENRLNQNKLIIGSSCINDYSQIKDASGKSAKELQKENKENINVINNEQLLFQLNEDIVPTMREFGSINIGKYYTNSIDKKIEGLKKSYDKYLKHLKAKVLNEKQINDIKAIYIKTHAVVAEANDFIERSKNNILGITIDIWEWCQRRNSNLFIILKERGIIDYGILELIKEPNFLRKTIKRFDPLLLKNDIKLIKIEESYFSISFMKYENIIFDMDSTYFISKFKSFLSTNCHFVLAPKRLQEHLKIRNRNSLSKALNLICIKKFSNIFSVVFSDEHISINEIAFKNSTNGILFVVPYDKFINKFIPLIFENSIDHTNEINSIEKYILSNYTQYTSPEYKDYLKKLGFNIKNLNF